ncbi:MAG: prepilin peptidase, partial [Eubacteriales bacterium]
MRGHIRREAEILEIWIKVLYALIWFVLFMLGASVFSFLNVVIYRVPRGLDFVYGRSECPSCRHHLAPWQMIPVFNWLYLRGKCHYCGARISPRYPAY